MATLFSILPPFSYKVLSPFSPTTTSITTLILTTHIIIIPSLLYLALNTLQHKRLHPNEPPPVAPSNGIPYIGHILGMILQGGRYIKNLGLSFIASQKQTGNDNSIAEGGIFAMPLLPWPWTTARIYVITDPSLATAVQRASKTLSFTPLVPRLTKRVLGLDHETFEITQQNLDPEPGEERGFIADIHDLVNASLASGTRELEKLSAAAAREMAAGVNAFMSDNADRETAVIVDLLPWIRHVVITATAKFLYGAQNPIALHPELEQAFWDFDHGLGGLLMDLFPSVTAKKAYRGREALVKGFEEYLDRGLYKNEDVSEIARGRIETALRHGWKLKQVARSDVSFLFAGIVNTATTTFWVVLQLFSNPDLLRVVREELVLGGVW